MLSHYMQQRKNYVWVCRSRDIQSTLASLTDEVFAIANPSMLTRERMTELRATSDALHESMLADIPWYAKVLPVR